MKFSEQWLRTLVNPSLNSEELAHQLTMAGLEVEENQPAAPDFDKVVVAEVLSVTRHENADRLNVCQVNIGQVEPIQIVCGAPNVAPGVKVPCALVGANLPGDFKIKQAKVRGVESFGMLCSGDELGMPDGIDGLLLLPVDAPVGEDFREYFGLNDRVFTLKLTPNRADCLSLSGIARELAALNEMTVPVPARHDIAESSAKQLEVVLDAPEACPRYCGRVVSSVDFNAPTPLWMVRRLARSGVRSISAIVDVTNYVMLELGQPMHAFDLAKIEGRVHARLARGGEQITLLNDKTIALEPDMLVIADDAKPLALAGIMGGGDSAISAATQDIFLESAYFDPAVIHGKSRRLGFGSDSSYRFERGVDFELQRTALERATELILDICGGEAGAVSEACASLPVRHAVNLRVSRIARVLGVSLEAGAIVAMLERLGLRCSLAGDVIQVQPPSFRFDLVIEEDLIEEVARLYGYDTVPVRPPLGQMSMLPQPTGARALPLIKQGMVGCGYQEVINYAFVDEQWEMDLAGNTAPVKLINPIASQMGVMRSTLLGGLIATLQHNLNRKHERVRLFEVGRVFLRADNQLEQPERLAGLAYGPRVQEQWGAAAQAVDFFDVKADVEALFWPRPLRFEAAPHPAMHPGRSAKVWFDDKLVGWLGELHPNWVQKYDLNRAPVMFELELGILAASELPQAAPISKFQAVRRDIAVVVDEHVSVQALLDSLVYEKISIISEIALFDVYRGKGVDAGCKSLAFRILLQDADKTLTDQEVDGAVARLVAAVHEKHGAKLRM